MSMRDISIAVRAENRASNVFRMISSDVLSLGISFGALDSATGRSVMQIFSVIRVCQSMHAIITTLTAAQTAKNVVDSTGAGVQSTLSVATTGAVTAQVAQNAAVQQGIIAQTANAIRLGASSAAHAVHAAAAWISTAAQNALNISYATFLALTGVGIAVIAAAAVAMFAFASSMNEATASVKSFNSVTVETPARIKNIQRSTSGIARSGQSSDEYSLYRRGIE